MTGSVSPPGRSAQPSLPVEQLRGFRIGVTSYRRAEDLISALERRGADVVHAPALKITPHEQDEQLIKETHEVIRQRPDIVVITTGYGMRRWFEVADAAGIGSELSAVLEQAVIYARGPKAVGAVRAAGLETAAPSTPRRSGAQRSADPDADPDADTTAAVVSTIVASGATNRRVTIQQHGFTDESQLERLRTVSESVVTVTPYRWTAPRSTERLHRLIEAACQRQLDAITFTSAPGAHATLEAAELFGRRQEFLEALREEVVAVAVGPVTARPLVQAGIRPVMPERFRLGAMIRTTTEHLERHRVQALDCSGHRLELRGRALLVDDRRVMLGPNALALFRRLAAADGVVSRQELMTCLGEDPDDHSLEVAMSRLRQSLGDPGLIVTVVKRGYRLAR